MKQAIATVICGILYFFLVCSTQAQEVNKGKIPADQLVPSFKTLAWGSPVWDVNEAVHQLKSGAKTLWIDTRPESFFKKGTVRGAILLPYNKQDAADNELTSAVLEKALADAGLNKDATKIVMFCQGPKCHRSYNATFVAVTEWGYKPENMIWFRAGYPFLLKEVKGNPKLKRKAKKYISDAGIKQL